MYRSFSIGLALIALSAAAPAQERRARIHVEHYAINAEVQPATQSLTALAPGHFVDMEYKIPASLTVGKTVVKVEFQAHAGMTAGGLYGCQILKR